MAEMVSVPLEMLRTALTRTRGWVGCGNQRDDHNIDVCKECSDDLERMRRDDNKQSVAFAKLCNLAGIAPSARIRGH